MKYTIIIPTMYYHVAQLSDMVSCYDKIDCIGEILIVNNAKDKFTEFSSSKVKTIGVGINKYVNPSWRFGVERATFDNVILANDDITIKGDLNGVLTNVGLILKEDMVFGPNVTCYTKDETTIKLGVAKSRNKLTINHGFGVFMILKKKTFLKADIPSPFLVWYGDHLLFLQNNAWEFKGIKIITNMAGTTSKLDLRNQKQIEKLAWQQYTAKIK